MSDQSHALRSAIELVHVPSNVRWQRSAPLPEGVLLLLRVAAGSEDALEEAAQLTRRGRDDIRAAAGFFIEQIMLDPGADSYRRLGANRDAPTAALRQHMALLMKWLHPDIERSGHHALFAERVSRAWDTIKTPERRKAYDLTLRDPTTAKVTNPRHEGPGRPVTQSHPRKSARRWTKHRTSRRHASRAHHRGLFMRALDALIWKIRT